MGVVDERYDAHMQQLPLDILVVEDPQPLHNILHFFPFLPLGTTILNWMHSTSQEGEGKKIKKWLVHDLGQSMTLNPSSIQSL